MLLCYSTWALSTLPPDRSITSDWRRKRKHKVQNKKNTKKYINPTKILPCYQHRCFLDSSASKYRVWERLHVQSIGDLNLLNELVIRSLIPKGKGKKLLEINGCFFSSPGWELNKCVRLYNFWLSEQNILIYFNFR